jgi:hypothetical protein
VQGVDRALHPPRHVLHVHLHIPRVLLALLLLCKR